MRRFTFFVGLLATLLLTTASTHAKPAHGLLVPPQHPVYEFLERMGLIGAVPTGATATLPATRTDVIEALKTAKRAKLDRVDRVTIDWYLREFEPPRKRRFRYTSDLPEATYAENGSYLQVRPLAGLATTRFSGGDVRSWWDIGASATGYVAPYVYFHGEAHMSVESGDRVGAPAVGSPEPGIGGWSRPAINYWFDKSEGYAAIAGANAGLWFGRFRQSWGPGARGQLYLSANAPEYPQVMLSVTPWSYLSYRFVVAQLQSGIIDSSTYAQPYPGDSFTRYYDKYLVAQRIEFRPHRMFRFALNQSVVYGADNLDLGYMTPLVNLRHVHNSKGDRDNIQLGADATLFWPRYTSISGALFIDEISADLIFDKNKNRNWIAAQATLRIADLWGLWRRSIIRVEYSRINPWVYEHRFPWSTYKTAGIGLVQDGVSQYPLGHWLGQNSDGIYSDVTWYPVSRLRTLVWAEYTRQGAAPDREVYQPWQKPLYTVVPFLLGPVKRTARGGMSARWYGGWHMYFDVALMRERVDYNGVVTSEWSGKVSWLMNVN